MRIRKLKISDLDNGFFETLENLSSLEDLSTEKAETIFKTISQNPSYHVFVVERGGEVVGTTTLFVEQKFIHDGGRVGHIEDVAVKKDFEGEGVGSSLIKRAIREAKSKGCYKVILNCDVELMDFYKDQGFYEKGIEMRFDLDEE